MADETSRSELGVALHELEAEPQLVGNGAQQRALAGAGWPLQQHVPIGRQRGNGELDLAGTTDHATEHSRQQPVLVSHT